MDRRASHPPIKTRQDEKAERRRARLAQEARDEAREELQDRIMQALEAPDPKVGPTTISLGGMAYGLAAESFEEVSSKFLRAEQEGRDTIRVVGAFSGLPTKITRCHMIWWQPGDQRPIELREDPDTATRDIA